MTPAEERYRPSICSHLISLEDDGTFAPNIDYPSFENYCSAQGHAEAVVLPEQATFCLSSGHVHCPLYQNATTGHTTSGEYPRDDPDSYSASGRTDPMFHAIADMEEEFTRQRQQRIQQRRRWGWIGALALFVSTIVCGGTFAAYIGWQMVDRDSYVAQSGTVTTLSSPATSAPPALYVVVTATSDPNIVTASAALGTPPAESFPEAVTATPAPDSQSALGTASESSDGRDNFNQNGSQPTPIIVAGSVAPATTAEPLDIFVQVPTRRPTPILDLAMVVPTQATSLDQSIGNTPIPTATPAPIGTPVVLFAAEDNELMEGKCTKVSWHVENVRAVYYENLGVDGHGEQEECLDDKPGDYNLTVVLPSGATEYYTVTVDLLLPTPTEAPTATFVPTLKPTVTWTPVVPTETPTPDMQYAVLLSSGSGSTHTCKAGESCTIDLRVTNASLGIDDLSVVFEETGAWDAELCRLDGVCSSSRLTIASVGPSNTALVSLKLHLPPTSAGKESAYVIRAISERSGGSAASDPVQIQVIGE